METGLGGEPWVPEFCEIPKATRDPHVCDKVVEAQPREGGFLLLHLAVGGLHDGGVHPVEARVLLDVEVGAAVVGWMVGVPEVESVANKPVGQALVLWTKKSSSTLSPNPTAWDTAGQVLLGLTRVVKHDHQAIPFLTRVTGE